MTSVTKYPRNAVEVITMRFTSLLLLFVIINDVYAVETDYDAYSNWFTVETDLKGCNLIIPKEVQIREEPQPESGPLLLHTGFRIFRLGDVPDSGGSFGVDFMHVRHDLYMRN